MDYETLQNFADIWGMLFLVVLFVGAVAFAFRPGAKKKYDEASKIPLKED